MNYNNIYNFIVLGNLNNINKILYLQKEYIVDI